MTADSSALPNVPALIPQKHGGALLAGGKPGNRGGSGNAPSILRERLRGTIAQRVEVLESIIDGQAIQRTEVSLAAVLEHAECPECGRKLRPRKGLTSKDVDVIVIEGLTSATPADRVRAWDVTAKYGLGTQDTLITPVSAEVRARVARTVSTIEGASYLASDQKLSLLNELAEVWRDDTE